MILVPTLVHIIRVFSRFLTNSYLREEAPNSYVVEQRVEW